jgi:hypothetical protein
MQLILHVFPDEIRTPSNLDWTLIDVFKACGPQALDDQRLEALF